jgi:hypothetical protein
MSTELRTKHETSVGMCGAAHVRRDWLVCCAVFVCSAAALLFFAPGREFYFRSFDHGVQLSIGQQILLGKLPGRDVLIASGPGAMSVSAVGLWASHSLLGETILCAAGYALALTLIYRVTARAAPWWLGVSAVIWAGLLLARFYKWYVWLFPLTLLWALPRLPVLSPSGRIRWCLGVGLLLGIEWLFRFDLAGTGMIVATVWLVFYRHPPQTPASRLVPEMLLLVAAFLVPVAAWFGVLASAGGWLACADYVAMTLHGSTGVATKMALSLPALEWSTPWSPASVLVLASCGAPATLLLSGALGLRNELTAANDANPSTPSDARTRSSRTLLAAALVGASLWHQALHRRDAQHLLQVLPPVIVALHVLAGGSCTRAGAMRKLSLAWCVGCLLVGVGLVPRGADDLSKDWHLVSRYRGLLHPLDRLEAVPAASAIAWVRQHSRPEDSILVFPVDCQYYALVNRRQAGLICAYFPGVFDAAPWPERDHAALLQSHPVFAMVPTSFVDENVRKDRFHADCIAARPEMAAFVRAHFPRIAFQSGGVTVLAQAEE